MNFDLKTCPFCGAQPIMYGDRKANYRGVECCHCGAKSVVVGGYSWEENGAKAAEAWNRRAPVDAGGAT